MASSNLPRFLKHFFPRTFRNVCQLSQLLGGMQTEKTFSQILRKMFSKIPRMQNSLPFSLKVTARDFPEKFHKTAALCCKYCSTPFMPFGVVIPQSSSLLVWDLEKYSALFLGMGGATWQCETGVNNLLLASKHDRVHLRSRLLDTNIKKCLLTRKKCWSRKIIYLTRPAKVFLIEAKRFWFAKNPMG